MTRLLAFDSTLRRRGRREIPPRSSRRCALVVGLAVVAFLCGCDSDSGSHSTIPSSTPTPTPTLTPTATPMPTSTPTPIPPPPMLLVLSAFPGEMAPVLERATIESAEMIGDHVFRKGTLNGVPVVIGMTGIGLVNATNTTREALERFPVDGIVVSAVAGSPYRIADVVVPEQWEFTDGTFVVDQKWLALAEEISKPGIIPFDSCTVVASNGPDPVCLSQAPSLIVGGVGHSSDPYGDMATPCTPGGNDVFGCDVREMTAGTHVGLDGSGTAAGADPDVPVAEDMETAAIAAEAAAHGLRFIAFRAVSDGAGDPLNLPGFPKQFFAYYHLAANNAAAATATFLQRIAEGQGD